MGKVPPYFKSLNCFPMVQGYYTALERTMFLDHCSDAHLKIWEANLATHYKGYQAFANVKVFSFWL